MVGVEAVNQEGTRLSTKGSDFSLRAVITLSANWWLMQQMHWKGLHRWYSNSLEGYWMVK